MHAPAPRAAVRRRRVALDNAESRSPRPHALQFALCPLEGVRNPGKLQRHCDILDRGHGRDEVERLEYDPHIAPTETGEGVFVELCQLFARDNDGAGIGAF